jgi:hypothetical protein
MRPCWSRLNPRCACSPAQTVCPAPQEHGARALADLAPAVGPVIQRLLVRDGLRHLTGLVRQ